MNLEPAGPADLPALVGLLDCLFRQERDFQPDPRKQEQALILLLRQPPTEARVWVAREEGAVVGMVSLQAVVSTAAGGPALWLEDWIVLPAFRGRGIGAALLRHAIRYSKAQGFHRISLLTDRHNLPAKKIYAAHGFKPSTMLTMRLSLSPYTERRK
jgi:ribosomal protein S18 acetylase RimI-like enzyme